MNKRLNEEKSPSFQDIYAVGVVDQNL